MWTEHITEPQRLEQMLLPRLFAVAEIAWSRQPDYMDFLKRLPEGVSQVRSLGYACTDPEDCNPKGRTRRKEAVDFYVPCSLP